MKKIKALFVFSVALVICSSSAFALVTPKAFSKSLEVQEADTANTKSSKESNKQNETMNVSQNSSTSYDDVVAYLDGKVILTPSQVNELKEANAKVGEDIQSLKNELKKAQRFTSYTAKMGLAFGIKDGVGLQYGALGSFEIGLGKWSIGLGAQYMVGTMDDICHMFDGYKWSIDNATAQLTVGYTF